MKAITLRNLPAPIARLIQLKAKQDKKSINKTVVGLLEECTGVRGPKPEKPEYHDLDSLAGSWTTEEAARFEQALAQQREIDPDVWK
ncbi:MAG: hypothetical protein AB1451_05715 [Nitrospirota bacterium]